MFEKRLKIDEHKEEGDIKLNTDEVESFNLGHYEFEKQSLKDKESKISVLKRHLPNKTATEIVEYLFLNYQPARKRDPSKVLPKRRIIKRKRYQSSTSNRSNSKY